MHKSCYIKWHDSITQNDLTPISLSSSSSLVSSVATALLAILEFSPPYEARGVPNHLHELVSRSY
jgi:hypothetical protein